MADKVTTLPNKGQTFLQGPGRTLSSTYGTSVGLEGYTKYFDDVDDTASGVKTVRSNKQRKCMLVRNISGTTLFAKRVVKWNSTGRNRRVDGFCNVDHEEVAGVVDDALGTAGVQNHDLFWLHVGGPTMVETSPSSGAHNVISIGQPLSALTAANSTATTIGGRVQAFAATSNLTNAISATLNRIGRALTARTTANTSTDTLVDLEVMNNAMS